MLQEPEAQHLLIGLARHSTRLVSAATFVETSIMLGSRNLDLIPQLDRFLARSAITIEAVSPQQALLAREAFMTYGKGRHRAGLNFGDCFAYALAKATGYPLLFKGDDFARTDVVSALRTS